MIYFRIFLPMAICVVLAAACRFEEKLQTSGTKADGNATSANAPTAVPTMIDDSKIPKVIATVDRSGTLSAGFNAMTDDQKATLRTQIAAQASALHLCLMQTKDGIDCGMYLLDPSSGASLYSFVKTITTYCGQDVVWTTLSGTDANAGNVLTLSGQTAITGLNGYKSAVMTYVSNLADPTHFTSLRYQPVADAVP